MSMQYSLKHLLLSVKNFARCFVSLLVVVFVVGGAGAGVLCVEFEMLKKPILFASDYVLLLSVILGFVAAAAGAMLSMYLFDSKTHQPKIA